MSSLRAHGRGLSRRDRDASVDRVSGRRWSDRKSVDVGLGWSGTRLKDTELVSALVERSRDRRNEGAMVVREFDVRIKRATGVREIGVFRLDSSRRCRRRLRHVGLASDGRGPGVAHLTLAPGRLDVYWIT